MTRMLVIACGFAVACGGSAKHPTLGFVARLPESVSLVAGVDVAKLRATPFWAQVGPLIQASMSGKLERWLDACGIVPLRDVEWIIYAADSERFDHGVAIVHGIPRAKFERCGTSSQEAPARARRGRPRDQLGLFSQSEDYVEEKEDKEKEDILRDRFVKIPGDLRVGWIDERTAVVGDEDYNASMRLMVKVVDGRGGGRSAALRAQLARVEGDATLWLAGANSRGKLEDLDPIRSQALANAVGLAVSLRLDRALRLRIAAEQDPTKDNAETKTKAETRIQRALAEYPWLNRFQLRLDGATLHANLDLDAVALEQTAIALRGELGSERKVPAAAEPIPPAAPSNPDLDGDGVSNEADKCPSEAEDRDRFQDEDGCPDPDNDGDGIPDGADRCPLEAESRNGFEDQDGCPDDAQFKARQAQDQADKETKAKSRTQQGLAYLSSGLPDKALEEFRAAYALLPLPKLLYNIGVAYDKMNDRANAIDHLKRYVDAEPDDPLATEARKRIAELTKAMRTNKR